MSNLGETSWGTRCTNTSSLNTGEIWELQIVVRRLIFPNQRFSCVIARITRVENELILRGTSHEFDGEFLCGTTVNSICYNYHRSNAINYCNGSGSGSGTSSGDGSGITVSWVCVWHLYTKFSLIFSIYIISHFKNSILTVASTPWRWDTWHWCLLERGQVPFVINDICNWYENCGVWCRLDFQIWSICSRV